MSTRNEAFALFKLSDYVNQVDGDVCTIHFLSGSSRAIILSCLRYAGFVSSWYIDNEGSRGDVSGIELDQLEHYNALAESEVVMGCSTDELKRGLRMISASIAGEIVDLTAELPDGIDYSTIGLVPTLASLQVALEQAIESASVDSTLIDDIEEAIDSIGIILGAASVLP